MIKIMKKRVSLLSCHQGAEKQNGVVAILVAILLPVLIGFTALAIDIGHGMLVRGELQNAADATALAGAGCLYGRADCGNLNASLPDWSSARTKALVFASNNSVQNLAVSNITVEHGYWDLASATPSLRSSTVTPTVTDAPAIKVTISRSSGHNSGEVATFFAGIWGIFSRPFSASAVAAVTSPGSAGAGSLFPVVVAKCLFDNYWDVGSNKPKLATSINPPGFDLPQTIGTPYIFKMTSSYHAGVCESGQWSSLEVDSNNAPTIRNIIANGNSAPIGVGDSVWVQPGAKATLYGDVNACSAAGNKTCEYVMVPVVQNVNITSREIVVGLACLRIFSASGGSDKNIIAQLTSNGDKCQARNSGGVVGPGYGILNPPRLVQ